MGVFGPCLALKQLSIILLGAQIWMCIKGLNTPQISNRIFLTKRNLAKILVPVVKACSTRENLKIIYNGAPGVIKVLRNHDREDQRSTTSYLNLCDQNFNIRNTHLKDRDKADVKQRK
jgi:hypothetical protein